MKVNEIIINNYKSIDNIRFKLFKKGDPLSYTNILIGKNGSGKSNILEAISLPDKENMEEQDYITLCNKHLKKDWLDVLYDLDMSKDHNHIGYISQETKMPESLLKRITFKSFLRRTRLVRGEENFEVSVEFKINRNLDINKYVFINSENLKILQNFTPKYNLNNSISNLIIEKTKIPKSEQNYFSPLTYDDLEAFIYNAINAYARDMILPIDYWEPSTNYLLNDRINLLDFVNDFNNIPLKHLFNKCGYLSTSDIASRINDAKNHRSEKQKLVKELSKTLNQYLNIYLKEYNVEADIDLSNELDLDIYIKDKQDDLNYYTMSERSDGFKQYISFLLSLGIGNDAGTIKNRVILIDEPETHLHPSSIRSIKDQMINLGKNNFVFITTHSNFMLDNTQESHQRHYIVYKDNKCNTNIHNVKNNEDIYDEEILLSAFGFDIFNDILPRKILLVEGNTDKVLIEYALSKIINGHNIKVISCLSASKMPNTANYFTNKKSKILAITDDDPAGNDALKQLEDKVKSNNNKYCNLNDMLHEGANLSTIEDLLPKNYIEICLKKSISPVNKIKYDLNDNEPYEEQIRKAINIYLENNKIKKDANTLIRSFKGQIIKNCRLLEKEKTIKLDKLAKIICKEFD